MRLVAALAVAILGVVPAAEALTVRDIIELSRSGLGEDVLLALIEVDRGIYAIDPKTLKSLKDAGVTDRVIVAMVRSGREPVLPDPVPVEPSGEERRAPEPQVVVIEHHEEPRVREVMVPYPIYVPVDTSRSRFRRAHGIVRAPVESTFVPFQSGPPAARPPVQQPQQPVYWGFGGKLRPDAWQPEGHRPDGQKPSNKDR